ncbi:MAG: hypothetical protein K8U57_08605 [Planctomycetes bacterium]|nr:hypothetical protein [Planctomycetota bacterium]
MATEPGDTPQGIVALAFARALVCDDFEAAHGMCLSVHCRWRSGGMVGKAFHGPLNCRL